MERQSIVFVELEIGFASSSFVDGDCRAEESKSQISRAPDCERRAFRTHPASLLLQAEITSSMQQLEIARASIFAHCFFWIPAEWSGRGGDILYLQGDLFVSVCHRLSHLHKFQFHHNSSRPSDNLQSALCYLLANPDVCKAPSRACHLQKQYRLSPLTDGAVAPCTVLRSIAR